MKQQTKLKQTEMGEVPKDWEIVKLGDLGTLKNGVNFSRNDFGKGFPVINVTNLFRGRYATINDLDEIKEDTIKKPENYFVKKGDILFTRSSLKQAGVGQSAMAFNLPSDKTLFSGFIIRFRKKAGAKIQESFLNYLLRSQIYRDYLRRSISGTTITNINQEFLSKIPVILPSIQEQNEIVKILSSIDAKIELNNKMSKTIEEMGRVLFRHWFVENDKISEKWEKKQLDEIAEFLNGIALQKYPAQEGEEFLPVIKIRELRNGISNVTDKASPDIPEAYIINNGDVLFSWSGSLEVEVWTKGKGALNQHLFKVSSEEYPKWFYYFWTKNHLPEFRKIAEGKATTMGHIQRHHLSQSQVIVPDTNSLEKMNKIMAPLFNKMILLNIQSNNLSQIRDLLLPKLMSGKIRVQ